MLGIYVLVSLLNFASGKNVMANNFIPEYKIFTYIYNMNTVFIDLISTEFDQHNNKLQIK